MQPTDRQADRALQEFLSEAQETIEAFNRTLLELDRERGGGNTDPALINDAFRAVHSLKGLSGLFGVQRMTTLSHHLENLLDGLRLGRVEAAPEIVDLLFEAVEQFNRIVQEIGNPGGPVHADEASIDQLVDRIENAAHHRPARFSAAVSAAPEGQWGPYDFDQNFLSGLTEYEEHRLRENVRLGHSIFRIHVLFPLLTIDQGLEDLKARVKPLGETITLLPLPSPTGDDQSIALDVIVGSSARLTAVVDAVAPMGAEVQEAPLRDGQSPSPPPVAPADPTMLPLPGTPGRPRSSVPAPLAPPRPPPSAPPPPPTAAAGSVAPPPTPSDLDRLSDFADDRPTSLKSVAQTVRVDIRKLDYLMNVVGELALARAGIQAILDELKQDKTRGEMSRSLHREVRNFGRKLDELQAGILEVRMVPLGQTFDKLSRVVRKISRDADKEIRLVIAGAETELDKLIVEELSDPLMHLIRNSIDHGIEAPHVRRQLGKPELGTISIKAEQRGNHVVLTIEDDGAGLDEPKLIQRAVERGFLDSNAARDLSRRDVFNLIFLPGVSTKDNPDELSGRGVGMDVVKTNISRLSGLIDVESEESIGSRFTITLPITLAIIQALVIRVSGRTYAVPLNSVLEALLVQPRDLRTIERREIVTLRGLTLPILRLERAFRLARRGEAPARSYVVVVGMAQHRLGILVDELVGQQDIVIKSLGRSMEGIAGISGATELGGQQTVLVLDVAALVEEALNEKEVAA